MGVAEGPRSRQDAASELSMRHAVLFLGTLACTTPADPSKTPEPDAPADSDTDPVVVDTAPPVPVSCFDQAMDVAVGVGTTDTGYAALSDGAVVTLSLGGQGAFHLDTAVKAVNTHDIVKLVPHVYRVDTGVEVSNPELSAS